MLPATRTKAACGPPFSCGSRHGPLHGVQQRALLVSEKHGERRAPLDMRQA
jgi:hypothetical protein